MDNNNLIRQKSLSILIAFLITLTLYVSSVVQGFVPSGRGSARVFR